MREKVFLTRFLDEKIHKNYHTAKKKKWRKHSTVFSRSLLDYFMGERSK